MEFTLKTTIKAPAEKIYNAWLNSKLHAKMTGGRAIASDVVNDYFAAGDGYITGQNLELEPNKRILQSWRTTDFKKEEESSIVEVTLKEEKGITELILHHSKLPPHGEQYKEGWKDHYFVPMKKYFER